MKKSLLLLCLIVIMPRMCAAQNLVPNPSFEEYDTCPNNHTQVKYAVGWSTYGYAAADYFNACSSSYGYSVPNIFSGFQYAFDGDAYCGFFTYTVPHYYPNYREYITAHLTSYLIRGQKYFFSMKISCADYFLSTYGATNNIGVLFTIGPYEYYMPDSIVRNKSQVYTDLIITDTVEWVTVSGSFVADSFYNHINIGNFFDDSLTSYYSPSGGLQKKAYYYVDMVCVSSDSLTCSQLSFTQQNASLIKSIIAYPNPATTLITLQLPPQFEQATTLEVFDRIGQLVLSMDYSAEVDVSALPAGLYFLVVSNDDGERVKGRFVKE